MTIDEFITKLQTRYNKPKNEIIIEDLIRYLRYGNFTEENIDDLYEIIADNHKYESFPNRANIKNFWENKNSSYLQSPVIGRAAGNFIAHIIPKTKGYSVEKICNMIDRIRKDGSLNGFETGFVEIWEELKHVAGLLYDKGWSQGQADVYLEKVKQSIIRGEPILLDDLHVEEKANSITNLSQQEERQEKVTPINKLF